VIFFLLGCLLSLALVLRKLTSEDNIPWTATTVPLWVFMVFLSCWWLFDTLYFLGNQGLRKSVECTAAVGFLGSITVLPLTLMSYAHDHLADPAQYWKYCTIFYFPHVAADSLITIYVLFDHIRLWIRYLCYGTGYVRERLPICSKDFLHLFFWSFEVLHDSVDISVIPSLSFLRTWGYRTNLPFQPVGECISLIYSIHFCLFAWGKYTSHDWKVHSA
jgi:hypothetical protein